MARLKISVPVCRSRTVGHGDLGDLTDEELLATYEQTLPRPGNGSNQAPRWPAGDVLRNVRCATELERRGWRLTWRGGTSWIPPKPQNGPIFDLEPSRTVDQMRWRNAILEVTVPIDEDDGRSDDE